MALSLPMITSLKQQRAAEPKPGRPSQGGEIRRGHKNLSVPTGYPIFVLKRTPNILPLKI